MSDVEPELPPDRRPWRRPSRNDMVVGAILAGVVIFSGLFESTFGPIRWVFLGIAAALASVAQLTKPVDMLSAGIWWVLHKLRFRFARRELVGLLKATVLVGVAIMLGRVLVPLASTATQWAAVRVFGCPNATELRMLSTMEDLATAQQLADVYTRHTASTHQGCPAVHFHVYAMPPGIARDELRGGWSGNQMADWGPRPDLWLPGSTRHTITDAVQASNGALIKVDQVVVASTPLVLAVPAALSTGARAQQARATWAEELAAAAQAGWGVIRPEVARSVPAEMATVAMYASGGGDPSRLANPPAADLKLADPARARALERALARALDDGQYSAGDAVHLLCQHRYHGRPASAFAITEHQMVRFNRGLALDSGACAVNTFAVPPNGGLYAVYPVDTLNVDYPVMRLTWRNTSPDQREQATGFANWLDTAAGKTALTDAGLRPPAWPVGDPISARYGARSGVAYPHIALAGEVFNEVGRRHRAAARPGRVLIAMDASGSMKALVGTGPQNRFSVAVDGVIKSSAMTGQDDEFGLWVFQGSGSAPVKLLPVGHHPASAAANALQGVQPGGGTPLYSTIVAGVDALTAAETETAKALVVLTDGEDYGSGVSPQQMTAAVTGKNVKVFVVAIGEARCATAALQDVTTVTLGRCFDVPASNVDTALIELFEDLWGES